VFEGDLFPLRNSSAIGNLLRIVGIERGANLHKLQAQRLNLGAEDLRHINHGQVTALPRRGSKSIQGTK
jgi:hypothetical protein